MRIHARCILLIIALLALVSVLLPPAETLAQPAPSAAPAATSLPATSLPATSTPNQTEGAREIDGILRTAYNPTRTDEGIERLQALEKTSGELDLVHLALASLYAAKGDLRQARAELEKGKKLQRGDYPLMHVVSGDIALQEGNLDGAVADYQRALDIATNPRHKVGTNRALAYGKLWKSGPKAARDQLASNPQASDVPLSVATLEAALDLIEGKIESALSRLDTTRLPDVPTLVGLAEALAGGGKKDEADKLLQQAASRASSLFRLILVLRARTSLGFTGAPVDSGREFVAAQMQATYGGDPLLILPLLDRRKSAGAQGAPSPVGTASPGP